MKCTFPQYKYMIYAPNFFNASHRNQEGNLDVKNKYLRIRCMKCEGYGHIQGVKANTWSDDESEECNEGEDLCNELVALVNLSTTEQCSSNQEIFASGPSVDSSTYESPISLTALGSLDIATIDATISTFGAPINPPTYESPALITVLDASDVMTPNVESSGDKGIFDKEMTHSYKIIYEKLVETVNEN